MNTTALILMLTVQLTVTTFMVYFIVRILRKEKK
jgi:hypothetical protein